MHQNLRRSRKIKNQKVKLHFRINLGNVLCSELPQVKLDKVCSDEINSMYGHLIKLCLWQTQVICDFDCCNRYVLTNDF
jgi:hypothetical protein